MIDGRRNAIDGVKVGPKAGEKKPGMGQLPNIKADAGVDRVNPAKEAIAANDSFNKHYNKELKVSEGKWFK